MGTFGIAQALPCSKIMEYIVQEDKTRLAEAFLTPTNHFGSLICLVNQVVETDARL